MIQYFPIQYFLKKPKNSKIKVKRIYDDNKNLISLIIHYQDKDFKGFISEKKEYSYNISNSLEKVSTYWGQIDTLEAGFQQLNRGEEIDEEFIDYSLQLFLEEHYDSNRRVIKLLEYYYDQLTDIYTF